MVTVCITSYNRWDLLEKTIDSFLTLNTYPIDKFILNEDSGNQECINKILQKYGKFIDIKISNKQGQLKSLDSMFKDVNTKYIFNCEDDYNFYGNPDFIKESIDILENNPTSIQRVSMQHDFPTKWLDILPSGNYNMIKEKYLGDWSGLGFIPSLIRLEDYKKIFPEGYGKYHKDGERLDELEYECSKVAGKHGYRAAMLKKGAFITTGRGLSTY